MPQCKINSTNQPLVKPMMRWVGGFQISRSWWCWKYSVRGHFYCWSWCWWTNRCGRGARCWDLPILPNLIWSKCLPRFILSLSISISSRPNLIRIASKPLLAVFNRGEREATIMCKNITFTKMKQSLLEAKENIVNRIFFSLQPRERAHLARTVRQQQRLFGGETQTGNRSAMHAGSTTNSTM